MKRKSIYPILVFFAVLLVSLIPYHHLLSRGYSDGDDFKEVYRAIVEDIPKPSNIFLTPHEGDRYRPVDRMLKALTVFLGSNNPDFFAYRNLLFHSICILFVYLLINLFTKNPLISGLGTLLFALSPGNVNGISVDIFTITFGPSLILFVLLIILNIELGKITRRHTLLLSCCLFLLIVTTFSSEMYAWTIPTFLLYIIWKYSTTGKKREYLFLSLASILGIAFFVIARQIVVTNAAFTAISLSDRYGIQPISQIIKNFGMLFIGMGNSVDHIFWINPIHDTIPTNLNEIFNTGIWISYLLSSLVVIATGIGCFASLIKKKKGGEKKAALPLVFLILAGFSVSVVAVGTKASETYLYLANAFLGISQALLVYTFIKNNDYKHSIVLKSLVIGAITLVLIARWVAVEHRNLLLAEKAARIESMQQELISNTQDFYGNSIILSKTCPPQPRGFSIYGADGLDMITPKEFVTLTLNNFDLQVKALNNDELINSGLVNTTYQRIIWVDDQGHMAQQENASKLICH